jgi:putative flavoprotein involved in K+ transport
MMEISMRATDVAVIGAGQAGLAMSRCLSAHGVDHVLLERGEVGARWRSHAWDSLRLLTPNWLNALPDAPYQGGDCDGFMRRDEFLDYLRRYSIRFSAPVIAQTPVLSLMRDGETFRLTTSRGGWRARAVVIATGQCDLPLVPDAAATLDRRVMTLHSSQYRTPSALPQGTTLVVGASASGVQIADELRLAGRDVTLAVGRHTRAPRTWRGRDIFWWMNRTGILAERTFDLPNPEAAMRQPTAQLAGRPDHSNVDLATLQAIGVRLTGRFASASGDTITFFDDLALNIRCAQAKLRRLLARIDEFAGFDPGSEGAEILPVDLSLKSPLTLSIRGENIRTIIFATGYRRNFSWLRIPSAIRPDGGIAHRDGATPIPGLYALGFRLLRKRDSHFIGGVGSDAAAITQEIAMFLNRTSRRAA